MRAMASAILHDDSEPRRGSRNASRNTGTVAPMYDMGSMDIHRLGKRFHFFLGFAQHRPFLEERKRT